MVRREVPVLVLAGGRGTRLAEVTDLPKPLIPVRERPFVTYLLEALYRQRFTRVLMLTGYAGDLFESVLESARLSADLAFLKEIDLTFLREEQPLGTAGALRQALPHVPSTALVLNGDSYCQVDLAALERLRAGRKASFCLAAVRVPDAGDYGGLVLGPDDRVTGFAEKGTAGEAWINGGAYCLTRRFLEEALRDGPASLENDVLPGWIQRDAVWALRTGGYFRDIGTPERLARAEAEFPPPDLA